MTQFMVPGVNDPSVLSPGYAFDNAYYRTMIVRLHLFDGSMQVPGTVDYIRYRVQPIPATGGANGYTRVITSEQTVDLSRPHNDTPIIAENTGSPQPGSYANMFADFPNSTLVNVPALEHYRLVHESPDTASVQQFPGLAGTSLPGIKEIKIFEYVKGAHIPGTGTIEIPIETGTGRTFIYRQESENGEFIVPYSTSGNSYDVRATGPYHIAGTDQYIDVTENAVVTGTTVNG
jgi:dolichyl-diphosphooligosaccharide--protein glycosyltransferase